MKYHQLPGASAGTSEPEDNDGFDTDDMPHSSDSELVSHPSDNEDPRSPSRSPSYTSSSRSSVDHTSHPILALSESIQDLDDFLAARSHNTRDDDFFLVEQSDVDTTSRPHSSLSLHSDHDRHDPMSLIYPSMMLSPPRSPLDDDDHEKVDHSPMAVATPVPMPMPMPMPIETHTDDVAPSYLDSSIETLTGRPHQSTENKIATEPETPIASRAELDEAPSSKSSEKSPEPSEPDTPNSHEKDEASSSLTKSVAPSSPSERRPITQRVKLTAVKKSPSIRRGIWVPALLTMVLSIIGAAILGSFFLATRPPAHARVGQVNYLHDHRVAVVTLDLFTEQGKRYTSRKPYPLQTRVLLVADPVSVELAPAQAMHDFAEPIVHDQRNGTYAVYITSLRRIVRKQGLPLQMSPWVCHESSYYLHLWFANGTRVPDTPQEIFTSSVPSIGRPLACLTQKLFPGDDFVEDDDDFFYWKDRYRRVTDSVSKRLNFSLSWAKDPWNKLVLAYCQVQEEFQVTVAYAKRYLQLLSEMFRDWLNIMYRADQHTQRGAERALKRARANAKRIQQQTIEKAQDLYQLVVKPAPSKFESQMGRQLQTLKKKAQEQIDHLQSNKVVLAAEELLVEAEEKLEAQLKAALESERLHKLAEKIDKDATAFAKRTEKAFAEAERFMDNLLHSESAQKVKKNVGRKLDDFKDTPIGKKIVKEAKAIQKDARRMWNDFQWRLNERLGV
ncbi:hypothetical protein BGZ74_004782 [Mortierella antarctica]|nr:hypothetical protein BGZ74_004782 [Mortierella antarctica]